MQRRASRAAQGEGQAGEAPASGGGEQLAEPVRDRMEGAFGTSFEDVRVHQDKRAEQVGAEAYTQGDDLHFAPGHYAPGSSGGDELIGHELTHVVQQRAGRVAAPQQHKGGINDEPGLEAEADSLGARAAAGEHVAVPGGSAEGASVDVPVQRKRDEQADIGIEVRQAEDEKRPIPPATVDRMILGTDAIRGFVEQQMARGLKADGKTFFYASTSAYAKGLAEYWNRFDPYGNGEGKSDAAVREEARAMAEGSVAVTLLDSGSTIHINLGAGEHQFRTILHEAMHQQMQLAIANLGMNVLEGFAEFLSEIVLANYGVGFKPAGVYRTQYDFVRYLAEVFGTDTMIRCAFHGEDDIKDEFLKYAKDADANWKAFLKHCQKAEYADAKKLLKGEFVPLREYLRPQDEESERDTDKFWDEADDLEREQREGHERSTWPAEGTKAIKTRIAAVGKVGMLAQLNLPRGGRHGIREGWSMEFGTESAFYPEEYVVVNVRSHACDVLVTRPFEDLAEAGGQVVSLRPR